MKYTVNSKCNDLSGIITENVDQRHVKLLLYYSSYMLTGENELVWFYKVNS